MNIVTSEVEEAKVELHEPVGTGSKFLIDVECAQSGYIYCLQAMQRITTILPPCILGLMLLLNLYASTTYGTFQA